MVVAILGIMASISLFLLGGQRITFMEVRAKRNAQELVSEFHKAASFGVNFAVAGDKMATLRKIVDGSVASSGLFQGGSFRVSNMDEESLQEAEKYILQDLTGSLIYDSTQ